MNLTTSGGITVELDRKFYAEFKRQIRAASTNLDDHSAAMKSIMGDALKPLADAWRRRLPGSLKTTVRERPTSLTVVAGHKAVHGDQPFLPWLEFGGTVTWYGHHADKAGYFRPPVAPVHNVHKGSGEVSSRRFMYLDREHVAEGRYRGPAVSRSMQQTTTKVADGIQTMLDRVFT